MDPLPTTLHTALPESVNNKIKVMRQMAHGFLDDEHFFPRMRAAFPEIR